LRNKVSEKPKLCIARVSEKVIKMFKGTLKVFGILIFQNWKKENLFDDCEEGNNLNEIQKGGFNQR